MRIIALSCAMLCLLHAWPVQSEWSDYMAPMAGGVVSLCVGAVAAIRYVYKDYLEHCNIQEARRAYDVVYQEINKVEQEYKDLLQTWGQHSQNPFKDLDGLPYYRKRAHLRQALVTIENSIVTAESKLSQCHNSPELRENLNRLIEKKNQLLSIVTYFERNLWRLFAYDLLYESYNLYSTCQNLIKCYYDHHVVVSQFSGGNLCWPILHAVDRMWKYITLLEQCKAGLEKETVNSAHNEELMRELCHVSSVLNVVYKYELTRPEFYRDLEAYSFHCDFDFVKRPSKKDMLRQYQAGQVVQAKKMRDRYDSGLSPSCIVSPREVSYKLMLKTLGY